MKVETKVARKEFPEAGIKAGDTYYRWKFRGSDWSRSKTWPTRQQLTRSGFLQTAYDLDDQFQALNDSPQDSSDAAEVAEELQAIANDVRELGEEAQSSLDNMPEQLQSSSSSGELLQERIEGCETWADELDSAANELESLDWPEKPTGEDATPEALEAYEQEIEDLRSQASEIISTISGCPF